jgi:hypothetical protein
VLGGTNSQCTIPFTLKKNEHVLCWTPDLLCLFCCWWLWALPLWLLLFCFWIITINPTFVTCYDPRDESLVLVVLFSAQDTYLCATAFDRLSRVREQTSEQCSACWSFLLRSPSKLHNWCQWCLSLVYSLYSVLNMWLYISMYGSFICRLFFLILWMWYFSNVFNWFAFFPPYFIMPVVSVMVPYLCPVFSIWLEYSELPLIFLVTCICSLYIVLNVLPGWSIYFSGQSRHFIWWE